MEGRTDRNLPGGVRLGTPPPEDMEDSSSPPMRISILLQAHNLPNADSRRQGKSDPFVVVEARYNAAEDWVKIGMTETVWNNTSPQWSTNISLQYSFGTTQLLRFRIFDRDSPDNDLRKHDYLGEVKCTVAHIVLADNQRITENVVLPPRKRHGLAHVHGHTYSHLKGGKNAKLTIRAEEERGDLGDSVTLQFAVSALRRGSKPFYTLKRRNGNDNGFSPVRFSEVHKTYDRNKKNLFKPVTVSLARLVNADMNRTLRICFSEYDRKGNHYRGGHADFTLNQLRSMRANGDTPTFSLVKTKANGVKKLAGTLEVVRFEIANSYTFLDYIGAGVEINAIIAVDMSSTNGNPRDPSSLQYNSRESPNEYVLAIREVGNVLADYDTDKSFPAFGFSACLPPSFTQFSHCFALSGDFDHPDCVGIEGVINAYHDSLDHVAPHAPCLINPVLDHVIRIAAEKDRESNHAIYTVLLLITDGDFDDKQQVADSICAAADLPLSIVIVGIGNSEFPLLDELDGDEERLCNSDGVPAARDIVQVVHFYKHKDNPAALARETLDEIPTQLVSYMRSLGIRPKDITPPPRPNVSNPAEQLDSPSCEPSGGASEASPATPELQSGNSYSAADILSLNILQGLHLDTPLNSVPQVSQPMLAHAQHQASSQSSIGALSSNTPPIVTGYGGTAGTHIPSSPAHLVHQPTMPVPQQLQSSPVYPYSSGGSLPPPLDNSLPPPLEMPPPVMSGSLPPPLHNSPFSCLNADPQAQRVQQQQPSLSSGALFPSMVLNLPPGAVPVAPEHSMQLPVHVPSTSGMQFPPHVLQGHLHRPT